MKNFKEKLKQIILDNIIAMIISFIFFLGSGYMMVNNIFITFKPFIFFIFFISFAIFMYNIIVLIKIDNLGKRMSNEWKNLRK